MYGALISKKVYRLNSVTLARYPFDNDGSGSRICSLSNVLELAVFGYHLSNVTCLEVAV